MLVFMDLLVKEMWLDPGDLQSMPAVPASLTRPVLGAFSLFSSASLTHSPPTESWERPARPPLSADTRLDDLLALAHHASTLPRDLHALSRDVAQHYAETRTFHHEVRNRLRRLVSASHAPAATASASSATLFIRTAPRDPAFAAPPDSQMASRGRHRNTRGRGYGRPPAGGGRRNEMNRDEGEYDPYQ